MIDTQAIFSENSFGGNYQLGFDSSLNEPATIRASFVRCSSENGGDFISIGVDIYKEENILGHSFLMTKEVAEKVCDELKAAIMQWKIENE